MGKLIVFAAPSGAGKTTIVRHILNARQDVAFSVSATTRDQRSYEVDGHDYYFLTPQAFREKIDENAFVEWEEVYPDQYYGTLKKEVERLWNQGKNIIFDIDVKGALSIKETFPSETLTIFIKPPSLEVLRKRLINRATEDEDSLHRRLEKVEWEMDFENKFDKTLVNNVLSEAFLVAETIVEHFLEGK
ncbi:MAG: guanylate kinase [Saprospiraceae bacterium]|nr:guanylate kinase [Saprospiraceae bacterium]